MSETLDDSMTLTLDSNQIEETPEPSQIDVPIPTETLKPQEDSRLDIHEAIKKSWLENELKHRKLKKPEAWKQSSSTYSLG